MSFPKVSDLAPCLLVAGPPPSRVPPKYRKANLIALSLEVSSDLIERPGVCQLSLPFVTVLLSSLQIMDPLFESGP